MSIFDEQVARKPDNYPWAKDFIYAMLENPWNDREFTFSSDLHDFKTKMTNEEKEMLIKTLSAIGQIEIAVKTFWAKLGEHLPHPSLLDLGCVMSQVEVVHGLAYERLISVLDMNSIFEENMKLDCISGRVKYLKKYNHKFYKDSKKQYVYALVLFTLFVENVSLFSQFYIVLWLNKNKNILKDTAQQIKYTSTEELSHSTIGIKLVNTIRDELPDLFDVDLEDRVAHEAQEALSAESKIVDWMLGNFEHETLNKVLLKEFIKDRINKSLIDIKFKPIFEVDEVIIQKTNWFNEIVLGDNMVDFFNSRPTDYSRSNQSFDPENLF